MKSKRILLPPTLISPQSVKITPIEVSAHECPRLLFRDLEHIFPKVIQLQCDDDDVDGRHASSRVTRSNLIILPTFQQSKYSLMEFTVDSEREKDNLLRNFITFAKSMIEQIEEIAQEERSNVPFEGNSRYWVDYTDPVTGYPIRSESGGMTFSEVDAFEQILPYKVDVSLQCRMISHPRWGIDVYPATIFTNAPLTIVKQALKNLGADIDIDT